MTAFNVMLVLGPHHGKRVAQSEFDANMTMKILAVRGDHFVPFGRGVYQQYGSIPAGEPVLVEDTYKLVQPYNEKNGELRFIARYVRPRR